MRGDHGHGRGCQLYSRSLRGSGPQAAAAISSTMKTADMRAELAGLRPGEYLVATRALIESRDGWPPESPSSCGRRREPLSARRPDLDSRRVARPDRRGDQGVTVRAPAHPMTAPAELLSNLELGDNPMRTIDPTPGLPMLAAPPP